MASTWATPATYSAGFSPRETDFTAIATDLRTAGGNVAHQGYNITDVGELNFNTRSGLLNMAGKNISAANSVAAVAVAATSSISVSTNVAGACSMAYFLNAGATTGTWQSFSIGRNAGSNAAVAYLPDTTTPGNATLTFNHYGDSANQSLSLRKGGNVGIGTSAPTYTLHLAADSAAKPSTSTWTISSDERIKTVVREFTDGLSVLLQLRPVVYRYNGRDGSADDGEHRSVLAQEAEAHIPYCIGEYDGALDGEPARLKNLNTSDLTWVLVNACRDLAARVTALEAK